MMAKHKATTKNKKESKNDRKQTNLLNFFPTSTAGLTMVKAGPRQANIAQYLTAIKPSTNKSPKTSKKCVKSVTPKRKVIDDDFDSDIEIINVTPEVKPQKRQKLNFDTEQTEKRRSPRKHAANTVNIAKTGILSFTKLHDKSKYKKPEASTKQHSTFSVRDELTKQQKQKHRSPKKKTGSTVVDSDRINNTKLEAFEQLGDKKINDKSNTVKLHKLTPTKRTSPRKKCGNGLNGWVKNKESVLLLNKHKNKSDNTKLEASIEQLSGVSVNDDNTITKNSALPIVKRQMLNCNEKGQKHRSPSKNTGIDVSGQVKDKENVLSFSKCLVKNPQASGRFSDDEKIENNSFTAVRSPRPKTSPVLKDCHIDQILPIGTSCDGFEDLSMNDELIKLLNQNDEILTKDSSKQKKRVKHAEYDNVSECECLSSVKSERPLVETFDRCVVNEVVKGDNEQQLILQSLPSNTIKNCTLTGFWANSIITAGDIVNIQTKWDSEGNGMIDDSKGMIVINPDLLLSGTSIVATLYCNRKAVLSSWYRQLERTNHVMFVGNLLHRIFQQILQYHIYTSEEITSAITHLLKESDVVTDMYALNVTKDEIRKELEEFVPKLIAFVEEYVLGKLPKLNTQELEQRMSRLKSGIEQWKGHIEKVLDIEENIWSPRLGIKGKVDVTVEVRIHERNRKKKIVPLELKTGRVSFSHDHQGQVILYSMMMEEKRGTLEDGLLLYIRENAMKSVHVGYREQRGLIQLRNELAQYLLQKPQKQDSHASLPGPLRDERTCKGCGYKTVCGTYYRCADMENAGDSILTFPILSSATSHLKRSHLEYFAHWNYLLRLEGYESQKKSSASDLWCMKPTQRQAKGTCMSYMKLTNNPNSNHSKYNTSYIHAFTSQCIHMYQNNTLVSGDAIVISTDRVIAIATGSIVDIQKMEVVVMLDRDLFEQKMEYFHIDRMEYAISGTNFVHLGLLMKEDDNADRLRRMIIDKEAPSYKSKLTRDVVEHGRSVLKTLNRVQQRAVMKALATEQYLLIEGMPGTGKTTAIVGLVEIMVSLGKTVLLTSYTHSAVDNILIKLKKQNVDFIRVGKTSRVHPDLHGNTIDLICDAVNDPGEMRKFLHSKPVVATTCLSMQHPIFLHRTFDFCILDEASQALQMAALGPLFCCTSFILVGDPQQLPPLVQSQKAKESGMCESLFERLQTSENTISLTVQYRMNQTIMNVANKLMYDGKLECGNEYVANRTINLKQPPGKPWLVDVLNSDLNAAVIFIDTSQLPKCRQVFNENKFTTNPGEAVLVRTIIEELIVCGSDAKEIGIIAPFRAQVKLLQGVVKGVEVSTVDQYQGRDKEVIVCSFTKSQANIHTIKNEEILNDKRRLNVAFTRAKCKLICIGDAQTLQGYKPFKQLLSILTEKQLVKLTPDQLDCEFGELCISDS